MKLNLKLALNKCKHNIKYNVLMIEGQQNGDEFTRDQVFKSDQKSRK
jgi:hypothetical protein